MTDLSPEKRAAAREAGRDLLWTLPPAPGEGASDEGAPDSSWTVILAHGAGAGRDHPFLETLAGALAERGIPTARFDFPYMRERRTTGSRRPPDRMPVLEATWREAVIAVRERLYESGAEPRLALAGKSMGGRAASRVAASDPALADALLCLGYPFHPPKKPERLRTAHLADLAVPTLILQGERDPFGTPDEVAGYRLSPAIRVEWLPDGDHSFKPRKRSGHTEEGNLRAAADAMAAFLRSLDR